MQNYASALQFFENKRMDREVDSTVTAKANGFLRSLQSFEFYFLLTTLIEIFDQIESLNMQLQKSELCVIESHNKVRIVKNNLQLLRDKKFKIIWKKAVDGANMLDIEEASIKRPRKIPKRLQLSSASQTHFFQTAENYYRKMYYEIFDITVTSLETRFDTETIRLLNKFEQFITGFENVDVTEITNFYKDFDERRLLLQRDMFLDTAKKQKHVIRTLKDVVALLKKRYSTSGSSRRIFKID